MLALIFGAIIGFMKKPWKQAAVAGAVLGVIWTLLAVIMGIAQQFLLLNPVGALLVPVFGIVAGVFIIIVEVVMALLGWFIGKIVAKYAK